MSESIDEKIERNKAEIKELEKKLELAKLKEEKKELERKLFAHSTLGKMLNKLKR